MLRFCKGSVHPHRCYHFRLIRPQLRLKMGGAMLEIHEVTKLHDPITVLFVTADILTRRNRKSTGVANNNINDASVVFKCPRKS